MTYIRLTLVRWWWHRNPIVRCVACGDWMLFWWRAVKRGWKYGTFGPEGACVLCDECWKDQR